MNSDKKNNSGKNGEEEKPSGLPINEAPGKVTAPELPEVMKNIRPNAALLHEVIIAEQANRRQGTAHTKDRAEVSGGGKKPWRQKGTGRARSGSNRSPVWKGGGVTFGPRNERSFKRDLPRKKKKQAAIQAMVQRFNEDNLRVAVNLMPEQPKTRLAAQIIKQIFPEEGVKVLVLVERGTEQLRRAYGNLPGVTVSCWENVNALRILSHDKLLFTEKAWNEYLVAKGGGEE